MNKNIKNSNDNILTERSNLVLVDGMSFFYRCYHAGRSRYQYSASDTQLKLIEDFTIKQFDKYLKDILKEDNYTDSVIAWDTNSKTVKKRKINTYKSNRKNIPGISLLIEKLKEISEDLGYYNYELNGFEADDLIGTLAKLNLGKTDIYTSDKDFFQLIDDKINVIRLAKGSIKDAIRYNEEVFKSEFEIEPQQYVDFKALTGDLADNYKGAPGVGKVTATKLLLKYNTIDDIYKNLFDLTPNLSKNLKENYDEVMIGYYLAQILTEVELVGFDSSNLKHNPLYNNIADELRGKL